MPANAFDRLPASEGEPPARALVVTCLDGCLPAGSLEAQMDPAGLLVTRTAGNLVPPAGASDPISRTIEDAVSARGVRAVVVCGHSRCAVLQRLFDPRVALDDLALAVWLEHAEAVRRAALDLPPAERLALATELNVRHQLTNLRTHPAVAAAVLEGRLRLFGWLLDPARGLTFAFDPKTRRFTRRAALDPAQNHLLRKEQVRAKAPSLLPTPVLRSRDLS